MAFALASEGDALRKLGRDEDALSAYSRALAACDKALGTDHPLGSHVRTGIGWVNLNQGDLDGARTEFERAIAAFERSGTEPGELGLAQFGLARALWGPSGDRRRAQQLATDAAESFQKGGALNRRDQREVESWLRTASTGR
jgi:tetratricopeptide (TPR) repeat protein